MQKLRDTDLPPDTANGPNLRATLSELGCILPTDRDRQMGSTLAERGRDLDLATCRQRLRDAHIDVTGDGKQLGAMSENDEARNGPRS